MDRKLRIGLIVVVVLALAYPAAAWLIGMSVQKQLLERERLGLEQLPYLAVVKRDYRRGVYSSTEEVTFGVAESVLKSMQAAGQDWGQQAQFTIRNNIHHGPLPQFQTFAPATIDTEFVLPPEAKAKLLAMIGDQASFTIRTRMKWGGGSTTVVHSTPFKKDIPDKGGFEWRGLDAKVELGQELGSQAAQLTSPGLLMAGPAAKFSLEDLKVSSDSHPAFEDLTVGKGQFSLAHLAIEAAEKDFKLDSRNLTFQVESTVAGDFVNTGGTIAIDSLDVPKFSATQLVWEVRMDHIHGASLASLTKEMRAAQSEQMRAALQSGPGDAAALAQQQVQTTQKVATAFQTYGLQILGHEPVIDMPHVGFKTPDGDLMLSVKLAAPGITPADVSSGDPRALAAIVPKFLQASINIRVDSALFDKLLQQSVTDSDKSDTIKARMQQWQTQGYVKVDGKALTTQVTFMKGQLQVNGLPFAPMMAPPPPPAPPAGKAPGRKPGSVPRRNPH